jgi:hypothetical protein
MTTTQPLPTKASRFAFIACRARGEPRRFSCKEGWPAMQLNLLHRGEPDEHPQKRGFDPYRLAPAIVLVAWAVVDATLSLPLNISFVP